VDELPVGVEASVPVDGVTERLDGWASTALAGKHTFLSYGPQARLAAGDHVVGVVATSSRPP
jgi:hypothetical protein